MLKTNDCKMLLKLCYSAFVAIIFCVTFGNASHSSARTIAPIGGLFNYYSLNSSWQAFKNIAPENNMKTYIGFDLPSKVLDTYSTSLELCDFTSNIKGFVALVDVRPTEGICDTVCLLCNKYHVAHLTVGWEPIASLEDYEYTFSYYPPLDVISKAYTELTKHLGYDKFTIFYENDNTFLRLHDIVNSWSNIKEPILFSKLDPDGDNRETFKNVFKVEHMSYHILDCEVDHTIKYLREILEVEEATIYQSFILSNLDAYTLDLLEVPEFQANVSVLHLATTAESADRWNDIGMSTSSVMLETALTADALKHLEIAVKVMISEINPSSSFIKRLPDPPAVCYQNEEADYKPLEWPLGQMLNDALTQHSYDGFTGNVQFDSQGQRINFELHYSKLDQDSKFVHVGTWASKTNILIVEDEDMSARAPNPQGNPNIRIYLKLGEPYAVLYETAEGEPALKGYAVDLVNKIFEVVKLKFKIEYQYTMRHYPGVEYGKKIVGSKKWNGLIGELMEHKVDMAVGDLTITADRNAVVDFSVPFMPLGISIIMSEPEEEPPKMFSFLLPLSLEVWLCLASVFMITSFLLLICARMSQDDWVNPHPCNQNPDNLQNIWSFYNCMWLCIGAIMCQGCDIMPRAAGSRWISGIWWFFALIVTSSYTANMSTFLSEGSRGDDVKDVKSLSEQSKVTYGTLKDASTYLFFKNANDSMYQKIFQVMDSAKPTVFTTSNEEGMDRVTRSKGKFAFFMESTQIEYYTQKNCMLKKIGNELDAKEYGIAFPKSSPYKGMVDYAILYLQENGTLQELKHKWWVEENKRIDSCADYKENKEVTASLKMKNTSGIFLVLGLGGIVGLIIAVIDFLLNAEDISVREKVSFREALMSEWYASMDPSKLQRLAAPPRSAQPSTGTPSPRRERSHSRAVSVIKAASSFINFDEIY